MALVRFKVFIYQSVPVGCEKKVQLQVLVRYLNKHKNVRCTSGRPSTRTGELVRALSNEVPRSDTHCSSKLRTM